MLQRIFSFSKKKNIFDEFDFSVEIIRTNKKTVSLIIRDGDLKVRCPKLFSNRRVYSVIKKKEVWVKKNILLQKEKKKISKEKYIDSKIYLFLGVERKLETIGSSDRFVILKPKKIIISGSNLSLEDIKTILVKWYKKEAKRVIIERAKYFSRLMNLTYDEIIIKDYKSKWGLCLNLQKKIYINWRLIMAPLSVIEYVIIHELCHLKEPNHSKKFWAEVKRYRRNFKQDKMWLNKNGFLLFF